MGVRSRSYAASSQKPDRPADFRDVPRGCAAACRTAVADPVILDSARARCGSRNQRTDAAAGPAVALLRGWILIQSGGAQAEEGYAELERLLDAFGVVPRFVATDPLWRLLEADPRVQRASRARMAT
jgi:hypothetical protein